MSQFTVDQYEKSIQALKIAREQTIDGRECEGCGICGSDHPVFECGRNPLVAMSICKEIATNSDQLHETLHYLSGYITFMGEGSGPAKVVFPKGDKND